MRRIGCCYGGSGIDRISAGGGNDTVYTGTGTSYVTLDYGRTELHPNGRVARLFTTSSTSDKTFFKTDPSADTK